MLFSEVIGQREAKQLARQMVEGDRLPHAVLLYGSPGGGSLALALAFAQYVLCTDRRPDDACGECANCRRSSRMIHPDLHFSFPVTGANVTSDDHLVQWRAALAQNPAGIDVLHPQQLGPEAVRRQLVVQLIGHQLLDHIVLTGIPFVQAVGDDLVFVKILPQAQVFEPALRQIQLDGRQVADPAPVLAPRSDFGIKSDLGPAIVVKSNDGRLIIVGVLVFQKLAEIRFDRYFPDGNA